MSVGCEECKREQDHTVTCSHFDKNRLLLAADKQTSAIHDLVYAKPFDVKATSDAVWVLHGILRATRTPTSPPWCSVCGASHNFGEGDRCGAIVYGHSLPNP